jgi:hypothetical protein
MPEQAVPLQFGGSNSRMFLPSTMRPLPALSYQAWRGGAERAIGTAARKGYRGCAAMSGSPRRKRLLQSIPQWHARLSGTTENLAAAAATSAEGG